MAIRRDQMPATIRSASVLTIRSKRSTAPGRMTQPTAVDVFVAKLWAGTPPWATSTVTAIRSAPAIGPNQKPVEPDRRRGRRRDENVVDSADRGVVDSSNGNTGNSSS